MVHITEFVPSRQLDSDEAAALVRADYIASNGPALRDRWRQALMEEHGYRVFPEHLANFGGQLIDTLQ